MIGTVVPFDETKHPRGRAGKFADKPGSKDAGAASSPVHPIVGELQNRVQAVRELHVEAKADPSKAKAFREQAESLKREVLAGEPAGPVRLRDTKSWINSLTDEEKKAYSSWCRGSDQDIRNFQHGGAASNPLIEPHAEAIGRTLKAAPVYNKGPIYRGLHSLSDEKLAALKSPGTEFHDTALSSFSSDRNIAEIFAAEQQSKGHAAVLTVRQNRSAVDVVDLSEFKNEKEVLSPAKTKYRVKSAELQKHTGISIWKIELDEI